MRPPTVRPPYLVRFAARDLSERTNWPTTLAALVTIAAAVGFAVLSRGLALGAYRVELSRLDHDPTNRTLWFGNDNARRMTPARIAELTQALSTALPAGAVEGVYPFSRTADDWEWVTADGKSVRSPVGRTLRPDDRFLESYPVRGDARVTRLTASDAGIVAAPGMLKMLGYPDSAIAGKSTPSRLLLQRRTDGQRIKVPLLGVAQNEFPSFVYVDYVLGEAYETELRRENPVVALKEFRTGPLPGAWIEAVENHALPPHLVKLIDDQKLEYPTVVPTPKGFAWILSNSRGDRFDPDVATWKTFLNQIAAEMAQTPNFPAAPDFLKSPPEQETGLKKAPAPIVDHQYVAVVVNDVRQLPQAGRVVQEVLSQSSRGDWAVPLNEGTTAEVIKLSERTSEALRLLTIFSLGVAAVAVVNLLVVEWLRAERKLPEWGMLKAIGMTGPQLAMLGVLEGTALGALGAGSGIGLSVLIGRALSFSYYGKVRSDAGLGFAITPDLVIIPFVTALLVCALGTWWANRNARVLPPCESLRMR